MSDLTLPADTRAKLERVSAEIVQAYHSSVSDSRTALSLLMRLLDALLALPEAREAKPKSIDYLMAARDARFGKMNAAPVRPEDAAGSGEAVGTARLDIPQGADSMRPQPATVPAALIAEVRRTHRQHGEDCFQCGESWPCDVERLARALETASPPPTPPEAARVEDCDGCPREDDCRGRCGAMWTQTRERCIRENDHAGPHVFDTELAALRAEVEGLRGELEAKESDVIARLRRQVHEAQPHDVAVFAKQSDKEMAQHLLDLMPWCPTALHALLHASADRLAAAREGWVEGKVRRGAYDTDDDVTITDYVVPISGLFPVNTRVHVRRVPEEET